MFDPSIPTVRDATNVISEYLTQQPLIVGRDPLRRLVAAMGTCGDPAQFLKRHPILSLERIAAESEPQLTSALRSIRQALDMSTPDQTIVRLQRACAAIEHGDYEYDLPIEKRATHFTHHQLQLRRWTEHLRTRHLRERDGYFGTNRPLYLKGRVEDLERNPTVAAAIDRNRAKHEKNREAIDAKAAEFIQSARALPIRFSPPSFTPEPRRFSNAPQLYETETRVSAVARLIAFHDSLAAAAVVVNGVPSKLWDYSMHIVPDFHSTTSDVYVADRIYRALVDRCKIEIATEYPEYQDLVPPTNLLLEIYKAALIARSESAA